MCILIASILTVILWVVTRPGVYGEEKSVVELYVVTCGRDRVVVTGEAIVLCDQANRVKAIISRDLNEELAVKLDTMQEPGAYVDGLLEGLRFTPAETDLIIER